MIPDLGIVYLYLTVLDLTVIPPGYEGRGKKSYHYKSLDVKNLTCTRMVAHAVYAHYFNIRISTSTTNH